MSNLLLMGCGGSGSAPTAPESANRYAWWDASDLSTLWQNTNGTGAVSALNDPVGDWHDVDGNLIQWEQGTAANKPLFDPEALNGMPGIKFDGSNDYMTLTTVLNQARMDESTVFMVVSGWTTGTYQGLLGAATEFGADVDCYYLRITDTDKSEVLQSYTGGSMTSTAAVPTAGAVIGFKFSDSGNSYTHYLGRATNGSGSSSVTFSGNTSILGAQRGSALEYYSGFAHELIIYDAVLNATLTDNVLWYLGNKWRV
jgi:hypothetical protein